MAASGIQSLIASSKVISFDIFDTLLVRPFHEPTDLYLVMERQTGIEGFHDSRIRAEAAARKARFRRDGIGEVTLKDIYAALEKSDPPRDPWTTSALMQLELDLERQCLRRSPGISQIYEAAILSGRLVIGISDTYLPRCFIADILKANGIVLDRLYASSWSGFSKAEGTLYEHVADELQVQPHEILHFGDNFDADHKIALKSGIVGYYLPSLQNQLYRDTRFNQVAISRLVHRATAASGADRNLLASLLIAYLADFKARNPDLNAASLFGAMYAGPLVSGFATWLDVLGRADGVRRLFLAARDGYITKEIWDLLELELPASVLQVSRRLTLLPALSADFDAEFRALLLSHPTATLRDCVARLHLPDADDLLHVLARLTPLDRKLNSEGRVKAALRALHECRDLLRDIGWREGCAYAAYLRKQDVDLDKDAIADCGWALSSQRRMESFLGLPIRGYYIGALAHAHMHARIRSFLFQGNDWRGWADIAERGVELLELPFASTEPQIGYFRTTQAGLAAMPIAPGPQYERLRSLFVADMQAEIRRFAVYFKPYLSATTCEEFREVLFELFSSLTNFPTSFEYHELSWLPHDREFGQADFDTIATYWRPGNGTPSEASRLGAARSYLRLGILSLKQAGLRATWMRTQRVIRRKCQKP